MYSSKGVNYDYIDYIGYETCDNLIRTSGEGCRNIDTIRKEGIPKKNTTSNSETLVFGFSSIRILV